MATISYSGGKTYSENTTSTLREVPLFKNFPSYTGSAKSVDVATTFRVNSTTTYTFTVYLFKTFTYDSSYWQERSSDTGYDYSCFYQYPNNTSRYFTPSMVSDILASKTITQSISTGDHTLSLDLTAFGKDLSNWAGDVYMAIDATGSLYWGNGSVSTITIERGSGIIKYCTNGSFVDCEVYYGVDGNWAPMQLYYGTDGSYVELGE